MEDVSSLAIPPFRFRRGVLRFWATPLVSRTVLSLTWVICAVIFWHAAKVFRIPPQPYFDGSVLCDGSSGSSFVVLAVLLSACTVLGTVIAGAIEFEAGFFCASLAMVMVSFHGGTIRSVLFETGGSAAVFNKLAGEMVIFGVILAIAWLVLEVLGRWSRASERAARGQTIDPVAASDARSRQAVGQGFAALLVQIIATGILVELLAVNESKNQVIGALFIASIVGAIAAHSWAPSPRGYWYGAGPLVLGFIGYLLAAHGSVTGMSTGNLQGSLAALARPLPMDYASVGVGGAILGFWISRGWLEKRVEVVESTTTEVRPAV